MQLGGGIRDQVRGCGLCDRISYVRSMCVHRLMPKTYPQVSRLEVLDCWMLALRRLPSFEDPFSDVQQEHGPRTHRCRTPAATSNSQLYSGDPPISTLRVAI